MNQLKQALMKAGVVKKPDLAAKEEEQHKKSLSPQKEAKKFHQHQVRTDCEYCKKYSPDVEYYRHNNKFVEVRWLCMNCADQYSIPDEHRETHQSNDARSGRFIRRYGRTKKF